MELVHIAVIDLNRPHSATARGFHNASNPLSGQFLVEDNALETLRAKVIDFAANSGVPKEHLMSLKQVSSHSYSVGRDVLVFDLQTTGIFYSTPYAYCRAFPALKIGSRYFQLSEISDVSAG